MDQLIRERLESELASLKSQTNPHFLFNALNTIYGLSRRQKDDSAANAIIQLSDIMRYVLYECDVPFIAIDREIVFLKQYVAFAALRSYDSEHISLEISGDFRHHLIAPLLLIQFLENAFKHGLGSSSDNWVKVAIILNGNELNFSCSNNYNERTINNRKGNGIGLKGVKRRLELVYPGRHKFEIHKSDCSFDINLTIEL